MLELLHRLKPPKQDANIMEEVAKLAAKEREVRTLERLIEYISSLEDEDLARVRPVLLQRSTLSNFKSVPCQNREHQTEIYLEQ